MPHYINGREAKDGDPVVGKDWNGKPIAGVVHSITASDACNCSVAVPVPGGINQLGGIMTKSLLHAEDAFKAGVAADAINYPIPSPATSCCEQKAA